MCEHVYIHTHRARFIKPLGNRSALKGITFLFLFIYKYIADTSFILISCNNTSFGLVSHTIVCLLLLCGSVVQWYLYVCTY